MNRKKLLFIVNVDWFFVSHRLPIAVAAIEKGYEVHIACAITDKADFLESKGIIVHPVGFIRSNLGIWGELKTIAALLSVVRSVKPFVIHSVTIKPVLYSGLIGRYLNIPVKVSSISGLGYVFIAEGRKAKMLRALVAMFYRAALKNCNTVIFQNRDDYDDLRTMGAVKEDQAVFIRGSGVNLEDYNVAKEPQSSTVVMFLARLLIDKGVNEFVQAASILKRFQSDIRMVLVGDIDLDNPKSITEDQLLAWQNTGVVEYWGFSHNVDATIAKANIIALPSYREGMPKSLIEAAACGRAVITTNVPGCRDAIVPDKTGLLVPVRNADALVNAIVKLAGNTNLRYKFASNAREFAEDAFDIREVVARHLEIYGEITSG